MTEDEDSLDWDLVERLFLQTRMQPPVKREAFLERMADGDAAVIEAVKRLLANDVDDGFLEPPGHATLLTHLHAADAPRPDLTGHLLFGQYALGLVIGRGATGAVYAGLDQFRERPVAVKILRRHRAAKAVRSELASLRLLRLPGVVRLIDDGPDAQLGYCLVMEMVEGRPFGPALGPMPWESVRRTTAALLETLARIHARGMVHKDLKPGNVLVSEEGLPTMLDLGISGVPKPSASTPLIGTPSYMAPEVANGEVPDERSDLHAVGLMAYEALTGKKLYDAGHTPTTLMAKRGLTREQVDDWLADERVPDAARPLLAPLLQPSPFERPESARLAHAQFEPARAGLGHPAVSAGSEAGVAAVFRGHERVFHIPSDAARELWRRTTGEARDVQAELDAWERARLGRWEADGYHIGRAELEELRAGFHPRIPPAQPTVPEGARPLLPYVRVVPAPVTAAMLAEAARLEVTEVERQLAALVEAGILRITNAGAYALTPLGTAVPLPARAADYAGRLANAWRGGHPGRLELLIRAGRDVEVPAEAMYAARHAFRGASLAACVRVCELGLRTNPPAGTEYGLLVVLLRASIPQSREEAIERALMLVERSRLPQAKRRSLEQIARAALLTMRGKGARAWDALPTDRDAFRDEPHFVLDEMVRNYLMRRLPPEEQEARVRALHGPPDAAERIAAVSAWAWVRLLQTRFEEAAELFDRQLELAPTEGARMSILANVLYTRMLLFRLEDAQRIATELLHVATERRNAQIIARVEHDLRAIAYAKGELPPRDPELLDAVRDLGHAPFLGRVLLQEAAIAWRHDDQELATDCVAEACAQATAGGHGDEVDPLARSFHELLAPDDEPDAHDSLMDRLDAAETPSDEVQLIALQAMRGEPLPPGALDRFETTLAKIPADTWGYRREILSIDECVAAVKSRGADPQR
ncbi:MAG: serine/threonine-protein kinase [Planctomycetota bacterium]|nr:serine/threonine-protein kinase [Planctomycetota bacterium]